MRSYRTAYPWTWRVFDALESAVALLWPARFAPALPYLLLLPAALLTGSVVVESIFSIPGIGRYFVQAALDRDYTVVMGVVIVFAVLIIALNLIVDLLYGLLDPKVRQG